MARTWYDQPALKQQVLAHLDGDHRAGAVSPIRVGDHPPVNYWYAQREDVDALRAATGIPANVLAFGLRTGGLIENERTARWVIAEVRAFLDAVPVGAHLAWVVDELAARRLVDEEHGVIGIVDDDAIAELLKRVAVALRHGAREPGLEAEVCALLTEWGDEVPEQWQATGRVEVRVHAHRRALETARLACAVLDGGFALGRLVSASLHHPVELPWSTGSWQGVREQFRALLREAGGRA